MGRSEECAQEFAPHSHIHSGLNQQDLVKIGNLSDCLALPGTYVPGVLGSALGLVGLVLVYCDWMKWNVGPVSSV